MKKRARIVYNCFYPDFDDGYDEPIVARNLRSAKRRLLRWGWYPWSCGSIVRQVRHPLANLAQAQWVLRDPDEFDYRVVSRRRRKPVERFERTSRAYYARNMKHSRPEIARQEALEIARQKAEQEAWDLAHPDPLGKFPLPLLNGSGNLNRQPFYPYEPDPEDLPF